MALLKLIEQSHIFNYSITSEMLIYQCFFYLHNCLREENILQYNYFSAKQKENSVQFFSLLGMLNKNGTVKKRDTCRVIADERSVPQHS